MCSVVGGLMLAGTVMSAMAQKDTGDFNSAVARNNQTIQNQQAKDAIQRGKEKETRHRQKIEQVKGKQRAQQAANGFIVDSGSNLDILSDTAAEGEYEALTIRSNSQREAHQFKVGAMNSGAQAELHKASGKNKMMSTLITGGAGAAQHF